MPTFDFARPFQFLMEDPNWLKKVLLAGVFFFIPLVGPFVVMGYQIRIMRAVADGNESPLPDIQFGEDLVTGLKGLVAVLGYLAPGIVLYIGSTIVGFIAAAAIGGATNGGDGAQAASGIVSILLMAGSCLSMVLFMVGALLSPVALVRFADTGEIGAAYRFGEVMAFVKNNVMNILLAIVVGFVAQFIAQFGIILCFVGVVFTAAAAMMIQGHAWGQVLRIDRARNGVPATPAPTTPRMAGAY